MSNHLPPWLLPLRHLSIPPGPRGNTPPKTQWMTCLLVGWHPRQPQKAPSSKQWDIPPWYKVLKWSHSEAFSWDTSLVREARKEYFKKQSPNFTMDGTCDLSEVFRHMAKSATLLGLAIYEIQEVWEGPDKLQQANYALRSLPKGLKFPKQYPHQSPLRLWDWFVYTTWKPFAALKAWLTAPGVGRRARVVDRGQGGQGTVVNHLRTVHYRLSLVCNKCYNYPSTSSDTLHCHNWQNCQPSGDGDPNESALSE